MRGRDPDTGEFLDRSRSQQRRDALEVLDLAHELMELSPGKLAAVPMPDDLRDLVHDCRRITAHIARKRQTQFLAKAMRKEDEDVLDAIRRAFDHSREEARRSTAQLHHLEQLRERLLEEGDEALAKLLEEHPDADRQKLRQLIRNAKAEREKNKPPKAYRELFKVLKALGNEDSSADEDDADSADEDEHDED